MNGTVRTTRNALQLVPDPRRVIVKLFLPGEDAVLVHRRSHALVDRIAGLDDAEADSLLRQTLARFGRRHRDLEDTFRQHYEVIRHQVSRADALSPVGRLLVGAYCSHEYAVEGAALCNPSLVEHPDQTGLDEGQLRVVISFRQIGEGHLSSVGFASAVVGPVGRLVVAGRSGPLVVGRRTGADHRRDLLAAGITDAGGNNEISAGVLDALPAFFDEAALERAIGLLPSALHSRVAAQGTLEQLRRTNADSYATAFPTDTLLPQRVLWPGTPAESNGMEDARFVRFRDADAEPVYQATYTGFDGRRIAARMLSSSDLRRFTMTPMRGPGAQNKGIALFPRTVGGRHLALSRSDGETIGLITLDGQSRWSAPVPLHGPRRSWELIQVGNCGPPIETPMGWLVLTHGVGPMRRYAIGALMLDLHHPEDVIAELDGPLLEPDETERDGYVPNVVYSCGGLVHDGVLWLPYGASDVRVGFATIPLATLIEAMTPIRTSTALRP
ncbi:glycosylase [Dactylosporangium roseum]|uniref:Glycosylase n=1 Tax=Dactylosporangium roseum TaxID=47989 RepID=A0ABY5ZG34_9ACTN|nr:glycosylase [Dactylosporangium roseum]UWZ39663.1 glycosylase [Dactylosporangium roseum]